MQAMRSSSSGVEASAQSRLGAAAALVWAVGALACGGDSEAYAPPATAATAGAGGDSTTSATGGSSSTSSSNGGASAGGAGGAGGDPVTCEHASAVSGEQTLEIEFGGLTREYDVQIPLSYNGTAPVPLVFDFHGYTSNKDQQKLVSGFSELAENEGFIVVRVNGFGALRSWNAGDFCCGLAQSQDLDDVALVRAIAAEVSASACVNPRRIYATGISNGGALSHRLACEAADLFAAAAPVAYPIDRNPFSQCQPSRPIAVMHLHGRSDPIVPYGGSLSAPSTPDSFAYWGQVNGCTGDPQVTYTNDDSGCETYESCDASVQTTLCTVDGGHILYTNNDQVPIAELAWQFLSSFELP